MTLLSQYFSEQQLTPIYDGIRKFIRLQGLIYDPNPLVWNKWLADESELKEALHSVASAFVQTRSMIGLRKYVGTNFDAPKSVKRDMMTYLTTTVDGAASPTLQKRNLPMYLLVVEPVIDLFYAFDHATMVEKAEQIINEWCDVIDSTVDYGTYDDALVAQYQVQTIIREREEARKEEAIRKNKRRKSRDPVEELFTSLGLNEEELEEELF